VLYRLLLSDLDGTLCPYGADIPIGVKESFAKLMQHGLQVTLATGRVLQSVLPFAEALAVNAPLICCSGGLVIDHRTRRELYKRSVPIHLVVEAMSFSTEAGCRFATYLPDFQTSLRRDPAGGAFEEWVDGQRQRVVDDPFTYLHEEPLNCLLWTAGQQRTLHLLPLLQARLGRAVRVTQSAPDLLEVIPADVSKAHAATVLVGHLGIAREQVVAVGDSDNDVELLRWAGLGIAVKGATPAARAAADCVLESAAGAAAVEEIEWIVLGHELAGNSG